MGHYSQLAAALSEAGIGKGSALVFEAAGDNLGSGQAEDHRELVASLKLLLGDEGTLVVPTCTASEGYPMPTFDPLLSPSEMGAFSEFFRSEPSVVRSHSTTHSVAVTGSFAEELVELHRYAAGRSTPWGEGPFGQGSPWDWLYEHNAWWVLVDEPWSASPAITYVQALYAEGHAGITKDTCFPRFEVDTLVQELERAGVIRRVVWESHLVYVFETRRLVDAALEILETAPQSLRPAADFAAWLTTVEQIRRHGYTLAGVAKAAITPPIPCLRWDGKEMTGVYRDLYARVVAFSYREKRFALVLCDLEAISNQLVNRIREKVFQQIGLPPEAILIAATHAHSTPDTTGAGFEDAGYLSFLVDSTAGAICQAFANQQPVRVGWGRAPIRGVAQSRRVKLVDGQVYTTRYGVPSTWRVDPKIIAGPGEIDPDLTIIKVEALDGEILAAISNFACHATVALVSAHLSGDYPGEAMDTLERVLGQDAVALCTIGTAGDVDPTLEIPFWGPRNDQNARHLGRIFAAQVLEHLERVQVQDVIEVDAAREQVSLELRRAWKDLLLVDSARMAQEFATGWTRSTVVEQLLSENILRTEVHGLRLDGLILLGLPGEVFVEIGGRLKPACPGTAVSIVELANDNIGYLPTRKVWEEGGYEVGQHLWGRITLEGTDQLEAAARRVMTRLTQT